MIRRAARVWSVCKRAARTYDVPLRAVVRRAVQVHRDGFMLAEAAPHGFLDPRLPRARLDQGISRKRLRPIQNALNPLEFSLLTEDKIAFSRYCELIGLPTPRLLALHFRGSLGWTPNGRRLEDEDDWCSFFREELPDEFVLKPARSSYGIGVGVLTRDGDGFIDAEGRFRSPQELYEDLAVHAPFDAFLFQERLANHPALEALSASRSLQTVRVITLVDADRRVRVLFAELKLVVADRVVVDNLRGGRTGNISAEVRLDDGTLLAACRASNELLGVEVFDMHPRTGAPITGTKVPAWEEACELVTRAAVRFLPLRSLGWDVALTPNGPLLIEANVWWGPSNKHEGLGRMLREVYRAAGGRRAPPTTKIPAPPSLKARSKVLQIRRPVRVLRAVRSASRYYRTPFRETLRRAMLVHRGRGFSLAEASDFGLLDPALSTAELDDNVSRTVLRPLQNRLNPVSLTALTEDKGIFYRVCGEAGIPTPELYALYFRGRGGWAAGGALPAAKEDWRALITDELPQEFVLKPTNGHWGEGVGLYRRHGDRFTDAEGRLASASSLCDLMETSPRYSNWLFQERLHNHPEIARLTGAEAVQCARMVTIVDPAGRSELVWAHFRAVAGPSVYDNFRAGERGKLRVAIDFDDGSLGRAVGLVGEARQFVDLAAHPETGAEFAGVRLPAWADARRLVEEAALQLLPLRTLGWDVAFTPDGPVIIEANAWWGPPNGLGGIRALVERLRAQAGEPRALAPAQALP